jgi:hypothetical protein
MTRRLRVEHPGAFHHLMNRGDRHEPIFFQARRLRTETRRDGLPHGVRCARQVTPPVAAPEPMKKGVPSAGLTVSLPFCVAGAPLDRLFFPNSACYLFPPADIYQ